MDPRRKEAYKLRIQGLSYNEINAKLGIPKATLSGWFKDMVLSDAALARLRARLRQGVENSFVRHNKLQTVHAERRARENRENGKSEIHSLSRREVLLIGAALYWAEGHKRLQVRDGRVRMGHAIRFVNSDPNMIRIFIRFLDEAMGIDGTCITASMRLYPHINEQAALDYWTGTTGLSKERFRKTTYLVSKASQGKRPFNRLPWGTIEIQANNTAKFHHLMGWIEGLKLNK